jgi:AAA family ATP:ADP antiporter
MKTTHAAGLAMPVAGLMIAHQVAGKAVRDAAFLSAWPVSHLPAMVMATALVAVAAVPVYSWLFERFGPRRVVATGFVISAAAHMAEWSFSNGGGWVAVAVYLHIAGLSGLLLSGFWSVMSERFDAQTARFAYGRIAAAGTLGGLAGGLTVARMAAVMPPASSYLLLSGLHAACALGVALLGDRTRPVSTPTPRSGAPGVFHLSVLRGTPHLKTLALIVIFGTAAAAIADYLLKMHAVERISAGAGLLQFFATFYVAVQVLTFLAQFAVGAVVRRFGLGATISALPSGVAGIGSLTLLYPGFPLFITLRGFEAVLRGSIFRSAYELIFVPMDPVEKRRTKTFLDVTCDRAGDAVGAGIVQLVLLTGATYLSSQLVAAVIALSALGVWLGRRLDALYLGVVERRLTTHRRGTPVLAPSETGWTVLELSHLVRPETPPPAAAPVIAMPSTRDALLTSLTELRSGDRARVGRALKHISNPCPVTVGQIIQLLAWNDVVPDARAVLERIGAAHIGALSDALLSPGTDFAIRRRIPRVLGALAEPRAMAGLLAGLDDDRFEVRYQCSRGLRRLVARSPELAVAVDHARVMAVVAREVSAPLSIWRGYRLIDSVEPDETASPVAPASDHDQRSLEHVSFLLSTVLPAGPLEAAMQGIRSDDADLRSVAIEYLEGVLPQEVWANLRKLIEATPTASADDAHAQSGPPPPATPA